MRRRQRPPYRPAPQFVLAPKDMLYELGFDLAKTVISWGVPLVGIALLSAELFGNNKDEFEPKMDAAYEFGLDDDDAATRSRGAGLMQLFERRKRRNRSAAPSYLKIERLNARLESFAYDLAEATVGRNRARRARRRERLKQAFRDELKLDDGQLDKIAKAEREFVEKVAEAKEAYARAQAGLRAAALAKGGAKNEETDDDEDESDPPPKPPSAKQLESDLGQATRDKARAEGAFLTKLAEVVPDPRVRGRVERVVRAAHDDDPVDALLEVVNASRAEAPQVFAVEFVGDVEANQVAQLREEVTAILGCATAGRDEVVVKLQTGGGTVTGYGLAAAQLVRVKDAGVRLTVVCEQVAASGGYMMACCADHVVASPFAVLGSIGVISDVPNVFERLQREGVQFQTVTAGKYKRTLTPFKKVTREDVLKQQEDLEDVLKLFKSFVRHNRPSLDVDAVATGETWFGQDALDRGLCDELKTFDDVILDKFHAGAQVYSVKYREPKQQPDLVGLIPAGGLMTAFADALLHVALPRFLADRPVLLDEIISRRSQRGRHSSDLYAIDATPRPRIEYDAADLL
ncbi:hypothetical protein CTAYLR_000415 [Chrysophaeum taylorii]|uniref:Protease SohB n=1 Tax=Chrysophaeum taylorii TaxID=2483200 RepID=A0AAD7XLU1_9STRA|nr:hypothetical protein CTAYLR_000415 [Chrysophaeum taylorii]